MKTTDRKGFTKVELIAIIAVVVILAAVLIPTFVSMNNQAKLAAEYQEKASQQIAELAEKLENINTITAEEISEEMGAQIKKYHAADQAQLTEAQVKAIITDALKNVGEGLTEDQVEAIVTAAMTNIDTGLTKAEAEKIVAEAMKGVNTGLSEAQVQTIVNNAVKKINTGLTEAQVKAIVTEAMKGIQNPLTEDQIRQIIQEELSKNQ